MDTTTSFRRASLTAGLGLLFMALLAPFAEFYVLPELIDLADPASTAVALTVEDGLFRAGVLSYLLILNAVGVAIQVIVGGKLFDLQLLVHNAQFSEGLFLIRSYFNTFMSAQVFIGLSLILLQCSYSRAEALSPLQWLGVGVIVAEAVLLGGRSPAGTSK